MTKKLTALRAGLVFVLLTLALIVLLVLNVNIGSQPISPLEVLRIVLSGGPDGSPESVIIWKIRMPRLLTALVLGGALSVSGFLLQTFFRNPIAGPYVLGISSGAKLLVGLVMIYGLRFFPSVPFWAQMAAAFAGSMLVTALVLLFSQRVRSMTTLLVVGIMIGSVCNAITDFFVTFADDAKVANLHEWTLGKFGAVKWDDLNVISLVVLVAFALSFLLSKPISAYRLGENYARSMGVNVKLFRVALIGLSSVLSACVTALSGPISFVGVAVPHMTKLFFGTSRPSLIIPGSFLLGGAFCMGCDLIARTAFAPTELAISTVTAVFGAPVVIALMISRQRRRTDG
ncbi:MAG: iron ABC transporter permease [Clostridia bacterium]|nr:iron ABC transporter permease [Clostridia bacterium]